MAIVSFLINTYVGDKSNISATSATLDKFKEKVISLIMESSIMETNFCDLCYRNDHPPVKLCFPCYDPDTVHTTCNYVVCYNCAIYVTRLHMNKDKSISDPKCPWCRRIGEFQCLNDCFVIDIDALVVIDDYLTSENNLFLQEFGMHLNPIKCPNCTKSFASMWDMFNHDYEMSCCINMMIEKKIHYSTC